MTGITLTAEDLRSAPPEVRAWIQRQMATLLGDLYAEPEHHQALAACTPAEARAILAQLQALLPVVSVFFELGREAPPVPNRPVRVFALEDIQRHAHLRAPEQVLECLGMINETFQKLRGDPDAMLCVLDAQGHCFVADATSQAVLALWQEIIAARALRGAPEKVAEPG